jgi:adenylate cyclase
MSEGRVERRLAAVLAADVAGYSRLIGADEEGTLGALRTMRRQVIDPAIAEHRGRIVKTTGDGLLAEFQSVVDALRCATAWQAAVPDDSAILWRIGIHQGDIVVEDGDIFGDGVNVAARLEALAEPSGICISSRVHDDTAGRLHLVFDDLGEQNLKNIARPVRAYRVRLAEAETATATLSTSAALALPDKPSIAVLPFQNMSGDPEQDYFADGMVEEITTALSRFRWLFVIARNSTLAYKGQAVDIRQVGRGLRVRYVLEGSVRKAGGRVRITAQLIEAKTGAHLWADRFDGALEDVFDLQDQVASSVVGAIDPRLRLAEMDRVRRKPTENLNAYDLYLRAMALWYRRTEDSCGETVRLLQQALELDPEFPMVMARIGSCRSFQLLRRWIPEGGSEVAEAVRLARQALAVGHDNADVLEHAGYALAALVNENETGLTAIDEAITLNPNLALAFGHRALVLTKLDRFEEAIIAAHRRSG